MPKETQIRIREIEDRLRSQGAQLNLKTLLNYCRSQCPQIVLTYDEIFEFLSRGTNGGLFVYSTDVIKLVEKVLEGRSFESMLDMNSLLGVIPISLLKERAIPTVKLSQQNHDLRSVTDMFLQMHDIKKYSWVMEHPMDSWDLGQNFDFIFSACPMSVRGHELVQVTEGEGNIKPLRDSHDIYLYNAIKHLKTNGVLLALYSAGIFERNIKNKYHLLRNLLTFDCSLNAVFSFSSGVYSNTRIQMLVLKIVKSVDQEQIFLAEVDDQIESTFQNYTSRKFGVIKEHGFWFSIDQYQNLRKLNLTSQFNKEFQPFVNEAQKLDYVFDLRVQLQMLSLPEIQRLENVVFIFTPKSLAGLNPLELIPIYRKGEKRTDEEILRVLHDHLICYEVNTEIANPTFVVRWLNSELGQLSLSIVQRGVGLLRIDPRDILHLSIWCPSLEIQDRLSSLQRQLEELAASVREQSENLFDGPNAYNQVEDFLLPVVAQQEKEFDNWIGTLPFPLAYILRRYDTLPKEAHKDRYERLDHFFEASLQLFSVILLSGLQDLAEFDEDVKSKIDAQVSGPNGDWDVMTVGDWLFILGVCTKFIRKQNSVDGYDQSVLMDKLGGIPHRVYEAILNPKLFQIFDRARQYRNRFRAHGGDATLSVHHQRELAYCDLLIQFRELFGFGFKKYHMVRYVSMKYQNSLFQSSVESLTGIQIPFQKMEIESKTPVEEHTLHFTGEGLGLLKLIPFVRMDQAPDNEHNTCYFYTRSTIDRFDFITYNNTTSVAELPIQRSDIAPLNSFFQRGKK